MCIERESDRPMNYPISRNFDYGRLGLFASGPPVGRSQRRKRVLAPRRAHLPG
jgi:hypothetical protein